VEFCTAKLLSYPAQPDSTHLYIWRELPLCISQNGKKMKKVKKLSAKTPAGRAARGGKERGKF